MAKKKSKKKSDKKSNVTLLRSKTNDALLEKYRKSISRIRSPQEEEILLKIWELRNAGMSGPTIATYLGIGREVVYNNVCRIDAFLLASEMGEVILAADALDLNVAEYILLMHSEFGVNYVNRHGDKMKKRRLFALASEQSIS